MSKENFDIKKIDDIKKIIHIEKEYDYYEDLKTLITICVIVYLYFKFIIF